MGLNLYSSNKIEILLRKLEEDLKSIPPPFFENIYLVTQTEGMRNYLSRTISRKTGIWAGFTFYQPQQFIDFVLKTFGIQVWMDNYYDQFSMSWNIYSLLLDKSLIEKLFSLLTMASYA